MMTETPSLEKAEFREFEEFEVGRGKNGISLVV
jgi:hypothetical protein